jgi:hypothetical protein
MKEKPDRLCYQWECARYPKCARAGGTGCSLDWIEEDDMEDKKKTVLKGECREESGYPLFIKRK